MFLLLNNKSYIYNQNIFVYAKIIIFLILCNLYRMFHFLKEDNIYSK
ncbi:hypothetical protein HMPREF9018_0759 [Prevotella amnii CRIS 21A-A]|uniref:Uncharacterized protein n=1 Tax=Prevotella amnii CRIS 21A-A TaxID=679191 RepID=E1GVF8_9BACT|nr:hypothetical protein HMPREF9018_0759 [Prevotella amnii CRIS 21A-A]